VSPQPAVARTEHLNGMELYYELRGEGAPLLLLHGFTGAGPDWQLIFPEQARAVMRELTVESRAEDGWRAMRQRHPQGDAQIRALWENAHAFKDSYEDVNFTPPRLATIQTRTLIVHGDRDPLYPVSLAVEIFTAIPRSYLWVVPNGGHGPIFGERAPGFRENSLAFLGGAWEGA
jgi:pimeloyl-ACP methyl ester carboxylesterase